MIKDCVENIEKSSILSNEYKIKKTQELFDIAVQMLQNEVLQDMMAHNLRLIEKVEQIKQRGQICGDISVERITKEAMATFKKSQTESGEMLRDVLRQHKKRSLEGDSEHDDETVQKKVKVEDEVPIIFSFL
jgi:P2-related tail formation protein